MFSWRLMRNMKKIEDSQSLIEWRLKMLCRVPKAGWNSGKNMKIFTEIIQKKIGLKFFSNLTIQHLTVLRHWVDSLWWIFYHLCWLYARFRLFVVSDSESTISTSHRVSYRYMFQYVNLMLIIMTYVFFILFSQKTQVHLGVHSRTQWVY